MSKILTVYISKFEDITKLSSINFYWRGQADQSWGLQTNLERQVDKTTCTPDIEKSILREFKRKQHLFESSKDISTNDFERIAKIQHHGGPTRLLDFTQSLLKSLYFSTENFDDNVDAAIWGINPSLVNRIHEIPNVEILQRELIFNRTSDVFTKYVEGTMRQKTVVFLEPFLLNHRLHVQQGLFAIPLDISVRFIDNLNSLLKTDIYQEFPKNIMDFREKTLDFTVTEDFLKLLNAHLIKIIIPKTHKRRFKNILNTDYGISSSTMFPDIDGFCKGLTANCEKISSTFRYQ